MPPLEKIKAAKIDPRDEAKHIARYLSIDGVPTLRLHRDEALQWSADRGCYRPFAQVRIAGSNYQCCRSAADARFTGSRVRPCRPVRSTTYDTIGH